MARKTWIQMKIDGEWRMIPKDEVHLYRDDREGGQSAFVMGDIEPFRSVVDGSVVTGRASRREHMRRHNLIEVGNEKLTKRATRDYDSKKASQEIKRELQRQLYN